MPATQWPETALAFRLPPGQFDVSILAPHLAILSMHCILAMKMSLPLASYVVSIRANAARMIVFMVMVVTPFQL
jgi:hypothetical protein